MEIIMQEDQETNTDKPSIEKIILALLDGKSISQISKELKVPYPYASVVKRSIEVLQNNDPLLNLVINTKLQYVRKRKLIKVKRIKAERSKMEVERSVYDTPKMYKILDELKNDPTTSLNKIACKVGYTRQYLSLLNKKYNLRQLAEGHISRE
jgi:hypothetical protein